MSLASQTKDTPFLSTLNAGALLVRKDAAGLLSRPYFAGGTVEAAISDSHFHKPRQSVSGRFEDGTISFLSISGLSPMHIACSTVCSTDGTA